MFPVFDKTGRSIEEALRRKGTTDLDAWMQGELGPTFLATGYISQKQLSDVMKWKLKTGKWRPNLQKFVDALKDSEVKAASALSLKSLKSGDLKAALKELCVLKGVGPATATAVLSAAVPSRCAFMSDEALLAVLKSKNYTVVEALELARKCSDHAKLLGAGWTANSVQRAVWASQIVGEWEGEGGEARAPPREPKSSNTSKKRRLA